MPLHPSVLRTSAAVLIGAATSAGATTLDFDLGSGGYHFDDDFTTSGIWSEDGYNVGFQGTFFDAAAVSSSPLNAHDMTDTGCCDSSYSELTITRADGAAFSFDGIELDRSISDTFVEGRLIGPDGRGNLAVLDGGAARLNYDNIRLNGTRSDGTEVNVFASGFTDLTPNQEAVFDPERGNSFFLELADADKDSLTDLTSLSISLGIFQDTFDIYAASSAFVGKGDGLDPTDLGGFSDQMLVGFNECLVGGSTSSCSVDGVGTFDFFFDSQTQTNFANALAHGDIMLSTDGDGDTLTPAPVPLPASGWFLLLAGGALVTLRRRAKA